MVVDGPSAKPSIVGCQLSGGLFTVVWCNEALGRLERCQINGAREAGLDLFHPSTSPLVSNNAFRDSREGIYIDYYVDAELMPGEGNTIENMGEEDVFDER